MIQKIIKAGNSLAITIPKEFIKACGLKAGDKVDVFYSISLKSIIIMPHKTGSVSPAELEFDYWFSKFKKHAKKNK